VNAGVVRLPLRLRSFIGARQPGDSSHALLVWGSAAVAAAWLVVFVTGVGIDVLLLIMLACGIVVLDRVIGDQVAEFAGNGVASILLAVCLGLGGWVLLAKGGKADEFFIAAESAGYRPLFYETSSSPVKEPPPPAVPPVDGAPAIDRGGAHPQAGEGGDLPGVQSRPTLKETSSAVLASWGIDARQPIRPAIRLETPEIVVTGRSLTLRAHLTAEGQPLPGVPVIFRVNGTDIGTSNTNARGVAQVSFTPRAARTHQIEARVERSSGRRATSARMLLHALPGR
jgi:hypothetical protein